MSVESDERVTHSVGERDDGKNSQRAGMTNARRLTCNLGGP
jgi:hypothetical protein